MHNEVIVFEMTYDDHVGTLSTMQAFKSALRLNLAAAAAIDATYIEVGDAYSGSIVAPIVVYGDEQHAAVMAVLSGFCFELDGVWFCTAAATNARCGSSPCMNGGSCAATGGGYSCTCPPGVTGRRCQTVPCQATKCFNGGTCVRDALGAEECRCSPDFIGPTCDELNFELEIQQEQAAIGAATTPEVITSSATSASPGAIAAGVAGTVVVIALIVALTIARRRRGSRATAVMKRAGLAAVPSNGPNRVASAYHNPLFADPEYSMAAVSHASSSMPAYNLASAGAGKAAYEMGNAGAGYHQDSAVKQADDVTYACAAYSGADGEGSAVAAYVPRITPAGTPK